MARHDAVLSGKDGLDDDGPPPVARVGVGRNAAAGCIRTLDDGVVALALVDPALPLCVELTAFALTRPHLRYTRVRAKANAPALHHGLEADEGVVAGKEPLCYRLQVLGLNQEGLRSVLYCVKDVTKALQMAHRIPLHGSTCAVALLDTVHVADDASDLDVVVDLMAFAAAVLACIVASADNRNQAVVAVGDRVPFRYDGTASPLRME